jgi:hypothetical protein
VPELLRQLDRLTRPRALDAGTIDGTREPDECSDSGSGVKCVAARHPSHEGRRAAVVQSRGLSGGHGLAVGGLQCQAVQAGPHHAGNPHGRGADAVGDDLPAHGQ